MVEHRSGAGHRHRFEYVGAGAAEGYLAKVTWDEGGADQMQILEYDAVGQRVAFTDALGRRVENDIDPLGRLTASRKPMIAGDVAETRFFYTASGQLRREERPRGELNDGTITDPFIVDEYEHDLFGHVRVARFGVNTAGPRELRYQRDPEGRLWSVIDPIGRRTEMTYDERGLMLSQTEAAGSPEAAMWRFVYDVNGNRTSLTDPVGHRIDYAYDSWDRLREMTLPGSPVAERTRIAFTVNRFDRAERIRVTGLQSPGSMTTLFESTTDYDERGRPWRRRVDERSVEVTHDADERVVQQKDQRGDAWRFIWDGAGHIVEGVDPLDNRLVRTFDAAGNMTRLESHGVLPDLTVESYVTTIEYDARDRPHRVIDPIGRVTRLEYDARDLRAEETDPRGHTVKRAYGASEEVTSIAADIGGAVTQLHQFSYDEVGRQVACTDPEGHITRYEFDARDRRTRILYPDGRAHAFFYGMRRQVESEITPGGTVISYGYGADAGRTGVTFTPGPGVAPTAPIVIFNDGLRRPVQLQHGGRSLTRSFDTSMRLRSEIDGAGTGIAADYDDATGMARLTYPDGRVDRIETDALGRISSTVLETIGSAALTGALTAGSELCRYTYHGPDRVAVRRLWNGVSSSYAYDGAGRLTGVDHVDGAATRQLGLRYVFDAADRRRVIWRGPGSETGARYDYDEISRLTGAAGIALTEPSATLSQADADAFIAAAAASPATWTESYGINRADARTADARTEGAMTTSHDWALDATYKLLSRTTTSPSPAVTSYAFDGDGRCTQDDAFTYLHDALGRLVEARSLSTSALVLAQEFDPLGRVARRDEAGDAYDQALFGHRVLQRTGFGGPSRQLAYGAGVDEVVLESDTANRLPLDDALSTTLARMNETGAVVEIYRYSPFGAASIFAPDGVTERATSAIDAAPRFGGHPLLAVGRYDARARVLDPSSGRFLQPDPFAMADSANVYAYAHHDPVNWVDPMGEVAILIGLAVAAGIGLVVGLGTSAVRQGIQIHEGSRDDFSWGELAVSGVTGAVLGPALVVAPELAIPLAMMGVGSAANEYSQGNYETGTFDLAMALLPFASKNVRSASFGRGSALSPMRGLGPIDPMSTRVGRFGPIGQDFLHGDPGIGRVTHLTTEDRLALIESSRVINPSRGASGLSSLIDGTREGSWHAPWRASQMGAWRRAMTGLPFRRPYVEFDVRPGELTRPGGLKYFFSRYQRQIPGPIDLTGRNPTFGTLPVDPPQPSLGNAWPFMRLPLTLDPLHTSRRPSLDISPSGGRPSK